MINNGLNKFSQRFNQDTDFLNEFRQYIGDIKYLSPLWYDKVLEFAKLKGFTFTKEELHSYYNNTINSETELLKIENEKLKNDLIELNSKLKGFQDHIKFGNKEVQTLKKKYERNQHKIQAEQVKILEQERLITKYKEELSKKDLTIKKLRKKNSRINSLWVSAIIIVLFLIFFYPILQDIIFG